MLNQVKEGDIVVREIAGAGIKTLAMVEIETVNEKGIFIEGCDGDFSDDSVYGYHKDGRPFASFTPGFCSTLLRVATSEDMENPEIEGSNTYD